VTVVWVRALVELRGRRSSAIAIALLIGLLGGVVLASAAGARRTDTAYPRFLAAHPTGDAVVPLGVAGTHTTMADLRADARLPQVADAIIGQVVNGIAQTATGRLLWNGQLSLDGFPTRRATQEFGGVKVLSGRLPGPNSTTEVAVGYRAHQDPAVHIGSTIQLRILRARIDPFSFDGSHADPRQLLSPVRVKVVGFFLQEGELQGRADVYIGPALFRRLLTGAGTIAALLVRLQHGSADYHAFSKAVENRTPDAFVFGPSDEASFVHRQTHVLALALWLFAALGGLVTLLIAAQVLARQAFLDAVEVPTLRALGMTREQVFGVSLVRFVITGAVGAAGAVAVAVALSPLTPIGSLARLAEPHPGVAFDAPVLVLGAVGVIVGIILVAAIPAWRGANVRGDALGLAQVEARLRPSTLATTVARAGLPVSAVAGVRLAVETGRGRTAVPVRSTLIGLRLCIATVDRRHDILGEPGPPRGHSQAVRMGLRHGCGQPIFRWRAGVEGRPRTTIGPEHRRVRRGRHPGLRRARTPAAQRSGERVGVRSAQGRSSSHGGGRPVAAGDGRDRVGSKDDAGRRHGDRAHRSGRRAARTYEATRRRSGGRARRGLRPRPVGGSRHDPARTPHDPSRGAGERLPLFGSSRA